MANSTESALENVFWAELFKIYNVRKSALLSKEKYNKAVADMAAIET